MKRLIAISLLVLCLSMSTVAGDIPFPGVVPTPTPTPTPECTENCAASATVASDPLWDLVADLIIISVTWP